MAGEQFLPSRDPNSDRLTGEQLLAAMAQLLSSYKTSLNYNADQQPYDIQIKTIDLSTLRTNQNPERIGFPFQSYFVVSATSSLATCNLQVTSQDSWSQGIPLTLRDTGRMGFPVRQAFITNTAQPGLTMTILFSVNTQFTSGSQIQTTTGGVSISTGSTMTPQTAVAVLTTATLISAANSTAKTRTLQLASGGGPIWISGTSSVTVEGGALPGIRLEAGDTYEWQNQGAIYAIANAVGSTLQINTEV